MLKSIQRYEPSQLRFWTERQLRFRDRIQEEIVDTVETALTQLNPAWIFRRVEGPILTPRHLISPQYTGDDVYETRDNLALRPETTASSYAMLDDLQQRKGIRLPLCVWQSGKSFRVEGQDGSRASNLRFKEFNQLELQCAYSEDSKADYWASVVDNLYALFGGLYGATVVESKPPAYSAKTVDLEIGGKEVASISARQDYKVPIIEVAFGLDRLVELLGPEA